MKNLKLLSLGFMLAASIPVLAQAAATGTAQTNAKPAAAQAATKRPTQADGQRVFEQNCSRCHNAPEGFPQRVSGTIARHMRVRAGLSQQDEQAILRFLNP